MPSELCPGVRRYIPNQLSLAATVNLQLFSSMRSKESYDTVVCTMLPVKKRLTFLPSDLVMVICAVLVPFQVAKEMSLDALVSLMWPKES